MAARAARKMAPSETASAKAWVSMWPASDTRAREPTHRPPTNSPTIAVPVTAIAQPSRRRSARRPGDAVPVIGQLNRSPTSCPPWAWTSASARAPVGTP